MKVGDLVRDEFGNIGVIIDRMMFGNGSAAQVQFGLDAGYNNDQPWILERLMEKVRDTE